MESIAPWLVLLAYCALTWSSAPRRVSASQFFTGASTAGREPGVLLVALSAAVTWVFAKSIANAADLSQSFGLLGAAGYTIYYFSFLVAGISIYLMRTQGGWASLPQMLVAKYGVLCAKLFLIAIAFRLFNEVWSNTKVMALYFGAEGSSSYWISAVLVTAFTVAYAWNGGMRASLLTDGIQAISLFILLAFVLSFVMPPLAAKTEASPMSSDVLAAGMTFCLLAAVQVLSYPFHDPVLTDRGFLNSPRKMLLSFLLAFLLSATAIFLFSMVGLYARSFALSGSPIVSVPAGLGLAMMMLFTAIMLLSGGSTIDSTFTSVSKLAARDWTRNWQGASPQRLTAGRVAILVAAVVGNLPLLSIYLGEKVGPAIIAATTISGTMVMGLAPIFLLSFLRGVGPLSFHLAFWPGVLLGLTRAVESFLQISILPSALALGSGRFAIDLGVNVWGLGICTLGFVAGAAYNSALHREIRKPSSPTDLTTT